MTRPKLLAISLAAGAVIGLVSIAADQLLGGTLGLVATLVVAYVALRLLFHLLITRRLPQRVRAHLEKQLDPAAGPPADAVPIELELADRWVEAANARDWQAFARLHAEDLRVTNAAYGRVVGRRVYMLTVRQTGRAYPDFRVVVDEVVAQSDAPGIAWVRFTETGTPRSGAPLDVTWWERWTLDESAQRLREVHVAGIVRMS